MISAYIAKQIPGDHPRTAAVRQYLAAACAEFVKLGLADPKFISELGADSRQKFWACISEALVADRLRDKAFGPRKVRGKGPDFLVMAGTRRVWIEVVCPEPINVSSDWLSPQSSQAVSFPHKEILLRWTSAIKAKAEALVGSSDGERIGYLKSGLVAPDDAYVIAVNGCQLRSGPFPSLFGISQFPFAAEAVFAIGPYQLAIDRESREVVDRGHQHQPFVLNKNRAEVPTFTFLDPWFNPISAIWALDMNGGSAIGNSEPSAVVHNPNAINPVPVGFLPTDHEYVATAEGSDFVLSKLPPSGAIDG